MYLYAFLSLPLHTHTSMHIHTHPPLPPCSHTTHVIQTHTQCMPLITTRHCTKRDDMTWEDTNISANDRQYHAVQMTRHSDRAGVPADSFYDQSTSSKKPHNGFGDFASSGGKSPLNKSASACVESPHVYFLWGLDVAP